MGAVVLAPGKEQPPRQDGPACRKDGVAMRKGRFKEDGPACNK